MPSRLSSSCNPYQQNTLLAEIPSSLRLGLLGASSLSDLFVWGSPLLPQLEMLQSLLAISLLAELNCSFLIFSGSMVGVWQGARLVNVLFSLSLTCEGNT